MTTRKRRHPETAAVRGATDLRKKNAPLATPIYQTSTFEVTDNDQQLAATNTDMFYTRNGNPTHTVVQCAIAELEHTDEALLFPSGMSAVTSAMLALLKSGDHIVAQRDIYGGVTKFLTQWLPKLGIETTLALIPMFFSSSAAFTINCTSDPVAIRIMSLPESSSA